MTTDSSPPSAPAAEPVIYERRGPAAWLIINRPQARNALSQGVRQGLFDGVRRFNADPGARVLVLTGAGDKAFCAGADLKEMAATSLQVPPPDFLPQFGRNIGVEKPTIAAVNGVAYAGGFLLAQSCDLCVAADTARFAITEVKVGRGAPWAAPLPGLIPPRIAMQILLTGDPIGAARAYEVGLVNEVVPAAGLQDAAQRLAERIAANAPLSVLAAKKTVALIADHPLSEAFAAAERIWEPVYLSDDAQEGPAAFRDKRPPAWKGR
ncbi:MAG TPA: enoyl-CoA hydratase-related protein [Streptosporangiaceae bacterium]|nr:enoyl-CoA hydratase-related protein [Streptosporangiaceae bacterium]